MIAAIFEVWAKEELLLAAPVGVSMDQLPTSVLVAEDFSDAERHGQRLARFCRDVHSCMLIAGPEGEIAAGCGLQ